MTSRRPKLLVVAPASWVQSIHEPLASGGIEVLTHGRDSYELESISYALSFRPPQGLLKSLQNLRAVFSLGAGIDGFMSDPDFPSRVPLVRFVDDTLSIDMAQYVVLHTLMHHRGQRALDSAQQKREWAHDLAFRQTAETRVGILGLGEIGTRAALRLRDLGFAVAGWSRSAKDIPGMETFAGRETLPSFLARSDVVVCLLPLTDATRGILNAETFGLLPAGAFVINAARGGHLVEPDLIEAIDRGHLAGAALDVFETEPLSTSSPLWGHPKITISPHIAAVSSPAGIVRMVLDGVGRCEAGLPLANVVSIAEGY